MATASSINSINKIHINSSTKMTLSDRFTAFSAKPKINPRTTRRSIDSPVSRVASIANRRLLKQLAQKHTMEAALKLKRRSLKPRTPTTAAYNRVNNGQPLKRGTIKALRLGPSGRLIKANSISNVATMEADFLGRRSPMQSTSVSRIAERIGGQRLQGARFPRRAGARPVWDMNSIMNPNREQSTAARILSRSRSRTRQSTVQSARISQLGISGRLARGRSNSRSRQLNRNRSRSRIDRMNKMTGVNAIPITSRLGRRPRAQELRARSGSRSRQRMRGGVASGRIQRRRNSVKAITGTDASRNSSFKPVRLNRTQGRIPSASANKRLNMSSPRRGNVTRGRARSRSRSGHRPLQRNNSAARGGATIANRQKGGVLRGRATGRATGRSIGRRGRSLQRGGQAVSGNLRNGSVLQQRRGRSRSRGRGRGGRQIGADKQDVKKEDLDKELDQYMSSTKSSNELYS